jgi:uncharacterized protein YcfJ
MRNITRFLPLPSVGAALAAMLAACGSSPTQGPSYPTRIPRPATTRPIRARPIPPACRHPEYGRIVNIETVPVGRPLPTTTILGAVVGGVRRGGRQRDRQAATAATAAATVLGGVAGAAIGNQIQRNQQGVTTARPATASR